MEDEGQICGPDAGVAVHCHEAGIGVIPIRMLKPKPQRAELVSRALFGFASVKLERRGEVGIVVASPEKDDSDHF